MVVGTVVDVVEVTDDGSERADGTAPAPHERAATAMSDGDGLMDVVLGTGEGASASIMGGATSAVTTATATAASAAPMPTTTSATTTANTTMTVTPAPSTIFDYAMASTYNTAGTDALVTSADVSMDPTTTTLMAETKAPAPVAPASSTLFADTATAGTEQPLTDKKTGRPAHPAWDHFFRGPKRNRFHHHAFCKYCMTNGLAPTPIRGVSGNMIRHLQKCVYCPEHIVTQLRKLSAQKDAVNFNKRHQTAPAGVDVEAIKALGNGATKKLKRDDGSRSSTPETLVVAPPVPPSTVETIPGDEGLGGGTAPQPTSAGCAQEVDEFMPLQMPLDMQVPGTQSASSRNTSNSQRRQTTASSTTRLGTSKRLVNNHHSASAFAGPIDIEVVNRLVLKTTLSTRAPIDWMSMEEFSNCVFGAISQGSTLPCRASVYNDEAICALSTSTQQKQMAQLKDEPGGVTLSINCWYYKPGRSNIVLFSLVNSLGEATAWKQIDVGMEEVRLEELSSQIKAAVTVLQDEQGIQIIAVVADSLLAYAATKTAITGGDDPHPPIAVLPSFEAFLNNCLGVILTVSESHEETMGMVIELVRGFSNKRMREYLRRECGDPDAHLIVPRRDSWFSFVECIDSVRQFEDMIKLIAMRAVIAHSTAGEELEESGSKSRSGANDLVHELDDLLRRSLSMRVLETIQNPHFWETVVSLSELMSPIKETYRLMHGGASNNASMFSLADVFYQLGRMYQQYSAIAADWEENPSVARTVEHARYLQEQVNKLWKLYDQPLLFMAYSFNYNMVHHPFLARNHSALQWLSVGKYAKEYFRRWFCARPSNRGQQNEENMTHFLEDVLAYKERKYPFDAESVCDFEAPRTFYSLISDSNPLMHIFGLRLFSIVTSVPSLSNIIPCKSSISRSASTTYSLELLYPLIQITLSARTAAKPSKEALSFVQNINRPRRSSSLSLAPQVTRRSSESSNDKLLQSSLANLQSGMDENATTAVWSEREWHQLSAEWKAEWEHEVNVGNVLDTVAGVSSRLYTEVLSLEQLFKEKLPSRLQQSREQAVVDV